MQADIRKYLQIYFRRRFLFLYPFVLTVFIMVVLSFVLPKAYVSSSVILIEEGNIINPLISGLAVSTRASDRFINLKEQILSWKSLTELTRRLKLDTEVKSQFEYEKLIKGLMNNIIVEPRGSQLVVVSFKGRDPKKVQLIVKTLTDIFILQNQQAQTKETDVAVSFLEDQLRVYRYKIKEDEINRLTAQLDNLLVDATLEHPLVASLKERIAKARQALNNDDVDINWQSRRAEKEKEKEKVYRLILSELKKDSDSETIPSVAKGLNKEQAAEGLPLDTSINENIYTMLLQRLETAKITKQLDNFKEGTRFTILNPPRLPLRPDNPDPVNFLLMGIVLGCAVGYGFVFLAESLDMSFKNIDDAKVELGLPVLGTITTIITVKEFNKKKQADKFNYWFIGIFFVLMVSSVITYTMLR